MHPTNSRKYRWSRHALAMILCALLALVPQMAGAVAREGGTLSGMVRVYLSSIGTYQSLDITIAGSYSVGGDTSRTLVRGEKITVSNQGGTLRMTRNGVSELMGSSFKLRRHATSGENGVRIAQARNSANLYPGDIEFRARSEAVQVIVHVYIEDYMRGVLPYEMSDSFPLEALKAQAVAARTYTLKKMSAGASDYDVVDTTSDQTYRGTPSGNSNCVAAVNATKGIVGMYNGSYMASYYTASNGGQTESVKNAWNSSSYPYLIVQDDPYDLRNSASSARTATIYKSGDMNSGLDSLLRARAAAALAGQGYLPGSENVTIRSVENVEATTPMYASPSRLYTKVVFTLLVTATRSDGIREYVSQPVTVTLDYFSEMESLLSLSLNSTKNEMISVEETSGAFKLVARRYGHGIGMSQRGAQQMASEGMTYEQILDFYYPGTERVAYTFTRTMLPALDGSGGGVDTGDEGAADSEAGDAVVKLQNPLDTLNLRKETSTSSAIIARIPHGTQLRVLERLSTWSRVQYGALSGYVMNDYLTFIEKEETPETPQPQSTPSPSPTSGGSSLGTCVVQLTSGKLNLRAQPTTSSAVLALLPNGTRLTQLSTAQNGWVLVEYSGITGYVSERYIRVEQNAQATIAPESTPTPLPEETMEPPVEEDATDQAVVILSSETQTLNLRLLPTTSSSILARIRHGSQVQVYERYSAWSHVRYGSLTGYVMNDYLYFPGNFKLPAGMDAWTDGSSATPEKTPVPETTITPEETPVPEVTITPEETPAPEATIAPEETPAPEATIAPEETPAPEESTDGLIATVKLSNPYSTLNVREKPSTSSARLGTIPHDLQVRVLEYGANWCGIDYAGTTGYVATQYLRFDSTPPSGGSVPDSPQITPTPVPQRVSEVRIQVRQYLNVRENPSLSARVIGRVRNGTVQTVTDTRDGFYEIVFNGGKGYISDDYAIPVAWDTHTSTPEPEKTDATPTPTPAQPEKEATPTPEASGKGDTTQESGGQPADEPAQEPQTPPQEPEADASPTASPSKVVNEGTIAYVSEIYERCGDENSALMELSKGESVRVIEYAAQNGWAYVETQGVYGYMRLKDLSLRYEVARLCGDASFSLYESASLDAQVVTTLSGGTMLSVLDASGDWAKVRIAGAKDGYVLFAALDVSE